MDEKVFDQPIRDRGISLIGFVIESVTLDDESNKKIDQYELSSNAYMQQGKLVGSFGDAVVDAANNPNGAVNGMMGVGMVGMASGGMMQGAVAGAFNNQGTDATQMNGAAGVATEGQAGGFCPKCGAAVGDDAFCSKCGNKLK